MCCNNFSWRAVREYHKLSPAKESVVVKNIELDALRIGVDPVLVDIPLEIPVAALLRTYMCRVKYFTIVDVVPYRPVVDTVAVIGIIDKVERVVFVYPIIHNNPQRIITISPNLRSTLSHRENSVFNIRQKTVFILCPHPHSFLSSCGIVKMGKKRVYRSLAAGNEKRILKLISTLPVYIKLSYVSVRVLCLYPIFIGIVYPDRIPFTVKRQHRRSSRLYLYRYTAVFK